VLCARLDLAGGLVGHARGLLGRPAIDPAQGLLFVRKSFEPFMVMHMFFMRFAIDLAFLDRDDRVIRIAPSLKPWRVSPIAFTARKALEIADGAAARSHTVVGDRISLTEHPPPIVG
jgi:hypothetical protein